MVSVFDVHGPEPTSNLSALSVMALADKHMIYGDISAKWLQTSFSVLFCPFLQANWCDNWTFACLPPNVGTMSKPIGSNPNDQTSIEDESWRVQNDDECAQDE